MSLRVRLNLIITALIALFTVVTGKIIVDDMRNSIREEIEAGTRVSMQLLKAVLYESDLATVKSEMATFFEVFPHGTVWSNDDKGKGYDVVLLGQAGPTRIDVDELEDRLAGDDHLLVAESLREVGFESAVELLATYAGRAGELRPWLKGAQINRDRNLRLQYLAGMALNFQRGGDIYAGLRAYRKYPDDLFIASEPLRRALEQAMGK